MLQWEYKGTEWNKGLIPLQESDFIAVQDVCIDEFTGKIENKYRLKNRSLDTTDHNTHAEKIIILTFQAYCRYKALQKRLIDGMTIPKSHLSALGGVMATGKSTRIVFCRECFSCPDLDKFHLSGENKAPVLKGRPRKKRIRNSSLAKELKRKRFLADLESVKKNQPFKKIKLSESEEGTESDLSEESTKSSESMDEADHPKCIVETPIIKKPPNGLLPVSIKQVVMVTHINDKSKAPPPLIPTTKIKAVVTSPPPLQKVKIKSEVPIVTKMDSGPPPLYPITQRTEASIKTVNLTVPALLSRTVTPESSRSQPDTTLPLSSSKTYTMIKSSSTQNPASSSGTSSVAPKSDVTPCHGVKAMEPLGNVDGKMVTEGRPVGIVKMEGKENLQESNKTKKKRLRQPGSMKEFNEDTVDEDEKYFMRSLREFMKSRDTPISKIPALGFKRVNLWTMYKTAQKLGGYDMVTTKRLWRQVYDALGGSTTITSAATYTRRHYERLLLPYERFARGQLNAKKGIQSQTPKTSQDNTGTKEQSNKPNGNKSPATNKINATSINDNKMSRITVNNIGGTNSKESRDNREVVAVTANKMSRDGLKSTVVKVKPNGAIPPYSVSVQSAKKDGVIPSTVIVTKSVDVPVSPIQSSPSCAPRNSSTPAASSKSASSPAASSIKDHVTSSVVTQKLTSTKDFVTQKQTTLVNGRDVAHQSQPVSHKTGYPVYSEEQTRSHQRKVSESEHNQEKRCNTSHTKYLTIAETYDLIHSNTQSTNRKLPNKRVVEDEQVLDSSKKNNTDKEPHFKHEGVSRSEPLEPLVKRRKTPSPCHAIPQHQYASHVENKSRNNIHHSHSDTHTSSRATPSPQHQYASLVENKSRNNSHHSHSDTHTSSHATPIPQHQYTSHVENKSHNNSHSHNDTHTSSHATPSLHPVNGITHHSRNNVSENSLRQERIVHVDRGKPDVYDQSSFKHRTMNLHSKEVVDLTAEIEAASSASLVYRRTSSPLYVKMTHPYQHEHVIDTCQRTDHRFHGNLRHLPVTQTTDSHIPRDHHDETMQKHNHRLTDVEAVKCIEHTFLKPDTQSIEFDQRSLAAEVHRSVSQRTSIESPDAHFQEWRRRQGLTQYPAYITNEPRRRPSLGEQPVPLHPQTPPLEHRYVYVQDDNGMPPRVLEEVPLILSSKPGMYYPEDSFYGAVQFYHGGWPAAGVADGMPFKGDPETIRNNNHLRSPSCVFMPTSQMFGSVGPMAPISPPIINQGHVATVPEPMHPHCLMTSPYPHNHVMVSQTPTRPLHSYT